MKQALMGNHAVARAVALSRVDVISAYPITPQTLIVEELSEMCARGECGAKFIKVESEHSALACCMGASATGARTFTATASHGLLLMHEIIHWAAGARTPIVMVNVNRAIAPPWNLWSEQTDSLSQRDTGWIQFYCENNQEALDTILQAYKLAERTCVPVMMAMDAFILSHTTEVVDVPDAADVDAFLPPYNPEVKLDPDAPHAFGAITGGREYQLLKRERHEEMMNAMNVADEIDEEFRARFGRGYGIVEGYRCEGAELVLLTSGTLSGTARISIDMLRDSGIAAGVVKVRMFRPFPAERIARAACGAPKIAVIDRNLSPGAGGIFAQELKAGLYGGGYAPEIIGYVGGLGGGDFTPENIADIARGALTSKAAGGYSDPANWVEL